MSLVPIVLMLGRQAVPSDVEERVVGGPCEGCENVFVGLPSDPSSRARIAGPGEAGDPMIIDGTVRTPDGRPAPGIAAAVSYDEDCKDRHRLVLVDPDGSRPVQLLPWQAREPVAFLNVSPWIDSRT